MKKKHPHLQSQEGAVLIAAVLIVTVLAAISATVLYSVSAKHQNSYQAVAWREALASAESGVERAMAELRTTIDDPTKSWTGWSVVKADGTLADAQTINRTGKWAAGYTLQKTETLPAQAGERNPLRYTVRVDVPTSLSPTSRRTNQSYRIRSTGFTPLAGPPRVTPDSRDTQLRKLSIVWDRVTGSPTQGKRVTTPEATRTIEVVAKPATSFKYGLISEINFKLNKKTYIDGYNSNYLETSNNGKYDPTKRTADGGTIVANRWKKSKKPDPLAAVAEKFDAGKATIYGDLLLSGSMKNVKNTDNVQGAVRTGFSYATPTNLPPTWTSVTANIKNLDGKLPKELEATYKIAEKTAKAGGPAAQMEAKSATAAAVVAAKGMELIGGSDISSPTRFVVEKIGVNKKDESLILSNPPGVTESWVEIWVTDEFKIEKGGTVFVSNGVHATIYLDGKKAEIKDTRTDKGGIILESGFAGDMQIVGVEAREDAKKETDDEYSPKKRSGSLKISDADFTGVINAPDWDVEFKPKDWDKEDTIYGGQLYGAVLGRKVKIGNGADYHYDAAVNEMGSVLAYEVAGWNEL